MPAIKMTCAEALEASIEKWRQVEAGVKRELGSSDCALCWLYKDDPAGTCWDCPVSQRTGRLLCGGTPYMEWHQVAGFRGLADTDEKRDIARREREFLESLRENFLESLRENKDG